MNVTHTTVPGVGVVHHCSVRSGQYFAVLDDTESRTLLTYDAADPDEPEQRIALDQDEADQLAEILHSKSLLDRLAAVERRLVELTGVSP